MPYDHFDVYDCQGLKQSAQADLAAPEVLDLPRINVQSRCPPKRHAFAPKNEKPAGKRRFSSFVHY
jgi:hypothetical protein